MNRNHHICHPMLLVVIITFWIPSSVQAQTPTEQDSTQLIQAEEPESLELLPGEEQITEPEDVGEGSPLGEEADHFEFLTALQDEEVKQLGTRLKRVGTSAKEILNYRLKEYNTYLDIFFPDAHSAEVQSYIIQNHIKQKNWERFEAAVAKFLYLYPQSDLKGSIITSGTEQVQSEKTFKTNQEKILTQWNNIPIIDDLAERYFGYISSLHEKNRFRSSNIFSREAWTFLKDFPDSPFASTVLFWLAQVNFSKEAYQESYSMYKKLLSLYPENPEVSSTTYRKARLEQEQLGEYKEAISSFRQFLEQFPEDTLCFDVQLRIATITDQNLNDWITAITEYEVVAQKYPETEEAIESLMRVGEIQDSKLNQLDEAMKTYNRVASSYSDQTAVAVQAFTKAGEVYEKSKDYKKAIDQYMQIHSNYPGTEEDLNILEKCASLYEKRLKNNDKTSEVLNMIVEGFPESKNAERAKKRLTKLNK